LFFFSNYVILTSFKHVQKLKTQSIFILGAVQIACCITESICGFVECILYGRSAGVCQN